MPLPHSKVRGELAEVLFLAKVTSLGLRACKPWGESAPYDFVLHTGFGLLRVQVKSAGALYRGCYRIAPTLGKRKRPYTARDIDFLVAYIAPENLWYILPVAFLRRRQTIWFCPADPLRQPEVEPFREAWPLLGRPITKLGN